MRDQDKPWKLTKERLCNGCACFEISKGVGFKVSKNKLYFRLYAN